jgi:nitrogen fixation protein FixH
MIRGRKERRFTGRQFLAIMVGAFVLVSAVNALMIWYALSTWSGLVSDSAYAEGLGFDRVLAASRAEAALGWKATIAYDPAGRVVFHLVDDKGQPLSRMGVSMVMLRPTREGFDRSAPLYETMPGQYEAGMRPPLPGIWDIRVIVATQGQIRFHAEQRVLVQQ